MTCYCAPKVGLISSVLLATLVRHPEIFKLIKTLSYMVILDFSFHSSEFLNHCWDRADEEPEDKGVCNNGVIQFC